MVFIAWNIVVTTRRALPSTATTWKKISTTNGHVSSCDRKAKWKSSNTPWNVTRRDSLITVQLCLSFISSHGRCQLARGIQHSCRHCTYPLGDPWWTQCRQFSPATLRRTESICLRTQRNHHELQGYQTVSGRRRTSNGLDWSSVGCDLDQQRLQVRIGNRHGSGDQTCEVSLR